MDYSINPLDLLNNGVKSPNYLILMLDIIIKTLKLIILYKKYIYKWGHFGNFYFLDL